MTLNEKFRLMEDIERHNEESIKRWVRMTHGQEYENEVNENHRAERQCVIVAAATAVIMIGAAIFDTLVAGGCLMR